MQSKILLNIVAVMMIIAASLTLIVFSQSFGSVLIHNAGKISHFVTAQSGSSQDIQIAVDAIASLGGGNVFIPAGNFTFNIDNSHIGFDNRPCGVKLYGGVNLIGAGNNQTILYVPLTGWNNNDHSGYGYRMMCASGSNDMPLRISGIYFQGSVNMTYGQTEGTLSAIVLYGVKDYRIDHCTFIDFSNFGVMVSSNYVTKWNMGVIDHCIFDNPYKETFLSLTGNHPYWAYGIIVNAYGIDSYHKSDWGHFFGQYTNDTCYIEDCSFARCRHCVAASQNGFYVLRYSNMTDMIVAGYGSYQDVHGGSEGCEVYNCTIVNTPIDNRSYEWAPPKGSGTSYTGIGLYSRGGFALYYNNTIKYFSSGTGIVLTNDQSNSTYRTTGVWVWSNTFVDVATHLGITPNAFPIDEGVDYFQYAKSGYVPYAYPHPLTQA